MGHSDYRTTSIYADYAPDPSQGALYAAKAFGDLDASPGLENTAEWSTEAHPTTNVRSLP